jgi:hypothetical protein
MGPRGTFLHRFAASSLQASTHFPLRPSEGAGECTIQRYILVLENNTGKIFQNDFHAARLIDAASRSINVPESDADAFD